MNKLTEVSVKNGYRATYNHYHKLVYPLFLTLFVLLLTPSVQAKYSGGTGEPNNPYFIATASDMNQIGAEPNDWGSHFLMVNDVNLAEYTGTEFNIIGLFPTPGDSNNIPFTGVFDGNDHTISNFTYSLTGTNNIGLFACVADPNAIIKDVGLIDPNINAGADCYNVGSLIGSLLRGIVSGCYVDGGSISGDNQVGGLIGNSAGNISNCHMTGTVNGNFFTGGLIGIKKYGAILNSDAGGTVTGNDTTGGLVGASIGEGVISGCYSTSDVYGGSYIGGLLGSLNSFSSILGQSLVSNCYAMGNVNGDFCLGGLIGSNSGDRTISYCYSGGLIDVNVDDCVGGLIGGSAHNSSYDSCFWDSEVNPDVNGIGCGSGPNVIGKATAEMKKESTFRDWDFIDVWNIGENQTYPYLKAYPTGDLNHDGVVNLPDFAIFAEHWLAGNN